MRRLIWLGCVALLAFSTAALTHSEKRETTPVEGETLAESPAVIELAFDSPMRIISVSLTSDSGDDYSVSPEAGRAASDTLTVNPPKLPKGNYTFEWRGISDDGHTLSGQLSFTVVSD